MNIIDAIRMRKSIRDFKNEEIPQSIIREILETACRAPSANNTQPWEFTVVTKNPLDLIRESVIEKLRAGEQPNPEHSSIGWSSEGIYRDRQIELAKEIFQLMNIKREDSDKRSQWLERGFRYFDAPAAIIICVDKILTKGAPIFDIGAITQNICLTALHYGLGTCIAEQGVMYPEVLRKICNIPENIQIIIAIAIGYPNWDFPANKLETAREPVEKVTTWCGFD